MDDDALMVTASQTLVLVDLDEGARVMAHGAAGLVIGDAVSAQPLRHGDKALIVFKLKPKGSCP